MATAIVGDVDVLEVLDDTEDSDEALVEDVSNVDLDAVELAVFTAPTAAPPFDVALANLGIETVSVVMEFEAVLTAPTPAPFAIVLVVGKVCVMVVTAVIVRVVVTGCWIPTRGITTMITDTDTPAAMFEFATRAMTWTEGDIACN